MGFILPSITVGIHHQSHAVPSSSSFSSQHTLLFCILGSNSIMPKFQFTDTTERFVAEGQIRWVLHRYATLAREEAPFDNMIPLYTSDAVFTLPNGVGVRPTEISKVVQGSDPAFIRHHLTTYDIDFVSDSEAKVVSLFFACTHAASLDHWGKWDDTCTRSTSGEWLNSDRKVIVEGSEPTGWFAATYGQLPPR